MKSPIDDLVAEWQSDPAHSGNIAHVEIEAARSGSFGELAHPLPEDVAERLSDLGVGGLYEHQAEAIDAIRAGRHTVIVAGTASGKSLAYQIPVVEALAMRSETTALAIFPTKALAQDQLGGFARLGPAVLAATYDGDTPSEDRGWVRRQANVVLTNPDMLHVAILPNHQRWKHFLGNLSYVVVDEVHSFKGVFGTHVALILRRLRRLADLYGADPVFVFTSATIGNPGELAGSLSGLDVAVIDQDHSPGGEKHYVLWNPDLEDETSGVRESPIADATRLFVDLVGRDLHTIVFSRSRKTSELVYRGARERLDDERADRVAPYRGGYLASERRRIEADLFSGRLLGVAATNALELGIDVGDLDAAVITTFPGTISSFRQQAGRSGRRLGTSLAVLVAGQDALDQYYMNHPAELFRRRAEAAVVNPTNPEILRDHVRCAAHEMSLTPADASYLGPEFEELIPDLVEDGTLGLRGGKLYWRGPGSPAPGVSIRSSGGPPYQIIDDAHGLLGTVDEGRAFTQCHPGAVYLHQGDSYVVESLDIELREVQVRPEATNYYTQPHVDKELHVQEAIEKRPLGPITVARGTVSVVTDLLGYRRKTIGTGAILDDIPLELPSRSFTTDAVWYEVPDSVVDRAGVGLRELPGVLHAAEHTAIAMLPLYAICDRWDVGGLSTGFHPQIGGPGWFIYDGYPGGAGIAGVAYRAADRHLAATLETLDECPCRDGCPSCVQSPKCGNFNEPLSKAGALALLRTIVT